MDEHFLPPNSYHVKITEKFEADVATKFIMEGGVGVSSVNIVDSP